MRDSIGLGGVMKGRTPSMILQNKKAVVTIMLLSVCSFQRQAYATYCRNSTGEFRTPIHSGSNVRSSGSRMNAYSMVCTSLVVLMPYFASGYENSASKSKSVSTKKSKHSFVASGTVSRKHTSKAPLTKRTGKRVHEKSDERTGDVEADSALELELQKSEKNIIELLVSKERRDNQMGREALLRVLVANLPWKLKHGRNAFLGPKIKKFARSVRGKSEDEFFRYFNWFLSDIQMDKRFFKSGGPRPKTKDRPWRRGFSEKEAYLMEFMSPAGLDNTTVYVGSDSESEDLSDSDSDSWRDDQDESWETDSDEGSSHLDSFGLKDEGDASSPEEFAESDNSGMVTPPGSETSQLDLGLEEFMESVRRRKLLNRLYGKRAKELRHMERIEKDREEAIERIEREMDRRY
jgi:hypothetical protein